MKNAISGQNISICIEPETKEPVPFDGTAIGAESIMPYRQSCGNKEPFLLTQIAVEVSRHISLSAPRPCMPSELKSP